MSTLVQALAAGATIVTPNNRLAREVAARFDAARQREGARAWRAGAVQPWRIWLENLWRAALAARLQATLPSLLSGAISRALWHTIVSRHGRDWMNSRGAARHAADAWATFHAWRAPDETLQAVAASALHDDPVIFAQWGARYEARLAELSAIDEAQLADLLERLAAPAWLGGSASVVLHGFLALTPQQRRLLHALRSGGMIVDASPASERRTSRRRTSLPTPRDEIASALGFARATLVADPAARVAVVVADLDARRAEVVALADEILCPDRVLALAPDAPRPYGISLGEPLSAAPLVACALDLIAIASGPIDATVAASLVRSPFLPDAQSNWIRRAGAEREWVRLGRRQVRWRDVLRAFRFETELHRRLSALAPPTQALRTPRQWASVWSDWLSGVGWPGSAGLTSAQWQAREAWSTELAGFASMGMVTGELSSLAALDTLRASITETLFQPEASPAQIQILGVLEAAGLNFDHAWLAGFDAQRWPGPVMPNAFLPLAWQRERGVPRAQADTLAAQARAVTSSLASLAPDVIVSHARTIDDAPAQLSPLFAGWDAVDAAQLPRASRFVDAYAGAKLERQAESSAPEIPAGASVSGGAQLFESQSACPFQAFARHRLRAKAWPDCPDGLTDAERGDVLHALLTAFWDAVRDQRTLLALDESALSMRIDAAVESAEATLDMPRWRALPPVVAKAESDRLAATLRAWVDEVERARAPFRVRGHESVITCEIGGLALQLRVDRIDLLQSGGLAVIDYKSGTAIAPSRWFGDRPQGLQLAVYADAVERTSTDSVRALAYAQLKAGAIRVIGIVENPAVWPGLGSVDRLKPRVGDWAEARDRLTLTVRKLARDVRAGVADVAPRDATTCGYCRLHGLCRVQVLDDGSEAGIDGE